VPTLTLTQQQPSRTWDEQNTLYSSNPAGQKISLVRPSQNKAAPATGEETLLPSPNTIKTTKTQKKYKIIKPKIKSQLPASQKNTPLGTIMSKPETPARQKIEPQTHVKVNKVKVNKVKVNKVNKKSIKIQKKQ